jgi:dipeptidase
MCDTLIAAAEVTKNKTTIFAKNSDRPPNEAQYLDWLPARTYPAGEKVQCTYIEIPQVKETNAVLLSKPFWMWGAEMGVNEHGLVIGNEAVFSKVPANKTPALLGMDLLRLALERAVTPTEAVGIIVDLLEEYGQGGNCFQEGKLYYHNSFLIAGPGDAWVLETVDKHWAAREISPVYSISNLLSLEDRWDRSSEGLEDFVLDKRFARSKDDINLSKGFSDFIYTKFSDGRRRCERSRDLLGSSAGNISIQSMAAILRNHQVHPDPVTGLAGADICMHASFGPIRVSQATGSMIVSLEEGNPLVFTTGTAAPCTGIFKPCWVDTPPQGQIPLPQDYYDPKTTFWSHERLHREVLLNYTDRLACYQSDRDQLEEVFIQGALELKEASKEERKTFSEKCFQQAAEAEESWLERVRLIPVKKSLLHSVAWRGFNREAGYSLDK